MIRPAYLLTTAAFQLVFGKLYTFFNIKWVFLIAIAIFEIGSLICGVAPNSIVLIVGRAIAGLGSAGVFSGAYLLIATSVPLQQRPAFNGIIGGVYGVSSVVGPLLGGAFTDKVSWRWCFYINLPIGAVAVAVILFFFTPVPQPGGYPKLTWKQRMSQFDLIGTVLFIPSIVCVLIALQWGGSTYAWSNGRIIALFVVFGLCLLGFIAVQFWKPETATLSPSMLANRTVWAAAVFAFFIGSAFFTAVYYIPIWFQAVKGVDAFESGIRNIPILLAVVVGTILSGGLVTKIGYYTPFMIAATVITSIGAGLLTTWDVDTGSGKWIGYQVLTGFGIGLGLQLPLVAIQTVLDAKEIPVATALVMFNQLFGASIFVSVGQSVLTNRLVSHIAATIPNVDARQLASSGATEIQKVIPPQYQAGVIQTYNDALVQVFYIVVAMAAMTTIGSVAMPWNSVKGKQIQGGAA
jgi:MFS family permease